MRQIFTLTPGILFLLLASFGCSKDPDPVIHGTTDSYLSGNGVFVINEGNFRAGNGSLSFFSYDSLKMYNYVFYDVNKRPLGDIPYSLNFLGERAYLVVNNSGKIEVMESQTIKSVNSINKLVSPRYISFVNTEKAYVTSLFSDSITIINLLKDQISGYININHTSESIVIHGNKAFVANWVGGNKIFVINTDYDQLIDSIEVGQEPESMVIDKNETLWVLCNGGWQRNTYAELIGIDTENNLIIKRFVFPSKSDSPVSLVIDGRGENLFYLLKGVRKMPVSASALPETSLIEPSGSNFYKLGINPENNEIFVTDVVDYQSKGFVMRYDHNGNLLSKLKSEIIPGSICFRPKLHLPGR